MRVEYIRLGAADPLPQLTFVPNFRVGLVSQITASSERMTEITDWLYGAGVKYFCAWGTQREAWHDSMDWSNLAACNYGIPDDKHVMTTWHDNESLDEMFWFLRELGCVEVDGKTPIENTLLLHIADTYQPELVEQFLSADVAD